MKQYEITPNDSAQRLDRFLSKLFIHASKSLIYKLNRKGKIKVFTPALSLSSPKPSLTQGKTTWKKQDNEYKLQVWDRVQVFLSDAEIHQLTAPITQSSFTRRDVPLSKKDVIFEDKSLLIVNKNAGQNVHPGDHKTQEVSLIEQVEDYFQWKIQSLTFKPSLIHRVDRDTSGIVMIAKQKHVLTQLSQDFKTHTRLTKTYFAIVVWKLSRDSGTIRKKLLRVENAKNENKVQVSDTGQEAVTHYKVCEQYKVMMPEWEQCISLLEIVIETGRMHQIRVHMAHLWNPILWDKTYGNKKLNSYFLKHFWVGRQMLHAWKISFFHPEKKQQMTLEAKLKKDMMECIKFIQK